MCTPAGMQAKTQIPCICKKMTSQRRNLRFHWFLQNNTPTHAHTHLLHRDRGSLPEQNVHTPTHTLSPVSTERSGLTRHQWDVLPSDRWPPSWDTCACGGSACFLVALGRIFFSLCYLKVVEAGGIKLMPSASSLPSFCFTGELDLCFLLACTCHTSLRNRGD